jgi:hypothetical protein
MERKFYQTNSADAVIMQRKFYLKTGRKVDAFEYKGGSYNNDASEPGIEIQSQ